MIKQGESLYTDRWSLFGFSIYKKDERRFHRFSDLNSFIDSVSGENRCYADMYHQIYERAKCYRDEVYEQHIEPKGMLDFLRKHGIWKSGFVTIFDDILTNEECLVRELTADANSL